MSISLNVSPGGGGGSGTGGLGIYNPLVRMKDDNLVGSSLKSDGTTNANGTLYPTGLNDVADIGSLNSQINTMQQSLLYGGFFPLDDYSYTTLQTKTKVAQKWFSKYKNFKQVKVAGMIQKPTKISSISNASDVIRPRRTLELSSTALVHLYDVNSTIYAICATIGADGALTYGTAVTIIAQAQDEEFLDICLIGTNKFAVSYKNSSSYAFAVVGTVSGTTITLGTGVTMSVAITCSGTSICALDTDKFIVMYRNSSDWFIYVKAATVAGTVISVGTVVAATAASRGVASIIQNGTNKACIFMQITSASTEAISLTVSGTTITLWTAVVITSGNGAGVTRGGATQSNRNYDHVKLATDKILFSVYWSQVLTAVVITMSGNVITAGPLTVLYVQNPLSVTYGVISGAYNAKLIEITAGSDYVFYGGYIGTRMTISGTSITVNGYTDSGLLVHATNGATRYNIVYNDSSIWGLPETFASTNAIDTFKHIATGYTYIFGMIISSGTYYMYCAISNAMSVSFYNDATLIGSPQTMSEAFLFDSYDISSAITTGKRAYLGIKNNEATTRYIYVYETLLEVE